MEAIARGVLQHYVNDNGESRVTLTFSSPTAAEGAHARLGSIWKREGKTLTWTGGGYDDETAALDMVKESLRDAAASIRYERCSGKHCKLMPSCSTLEDDNPEEIDSGSHESGFGPRFEITIPCEDPRQTSFAGRFGGF